jgi:alkylation response protein AidB-like acyl-CoA dehydrogenase
LIGKEGEGWTYAKFLLANERSGIAAVPHSKKGVAALKKIAMSEQQDGKPLLHDPSFRDKVADLEVQLQALEYTELRILSAEAGGGAPGPEVSFLKIRGSEIQQRITELATEAVGYYANPYLPGLLCQGSNEAPVGPDYAHMAAPKYFNTRKTSIYGGSNEIQKNIIAKMVLGL